MWASCWSAHVITVGERGHRSEVNLFRSEDRPPSLSLSARKEMWFARASRGRTHRKKCCNQARREPNLSILVTSVPPLNDLFMNGAWLKVEAACQETALARPRPLSLKVAVLKGDVGQLLKTSSFPHILLRNYTQVDADAHGMCGWRISKW